MELLLVLVIVGILAMVGISRIGSRSSQAVRAVMDELEGTLAAAHKQAVATGRDVTVAVQGNWDSSDPYLLAFGNATTSTGTAVSATSILASGSTAPEAFRFLSKSREHMHAGIVTTGSGWWSTAASGNTVLKDIVPFSDSSSAFASLVSDPASDAANLSSQGFVKISGANKRFNESFYIAVTGIRDGQAWAGGPMGLLVVLKNGATIYKYYNPGQTEGTDAWRKL